MKILITGSNGLLGQKLVKLLTEEKHEVIATARGENRIDYLPNNFEYTQMDITKEKEVMNVITKYKPEVVINTAAMTNVDQCEDEKQACIDLNVNSVKHLIAACHKHDIFLLHLSTDFIFDGSAGPYKETDEANPVSYYGESKLQAEQLLLNSKIKWAIARTVLVYGITPGMSRSNIILWVKDSIEKGKDLKIVNDQWRTPTLAEDLAIGCYLISQKKAEGIFNISGKDLLTPYDMAMKTCEYFNLDKSKIEEVDGSMFSQRAKRPPKTGFILDKAEEVLGYKPKSFEEGIGILAEQISTVD
ncbi:SDR family oxidoreductase [Reichenbachiella versicolor]|uniref:SDR family oxidoreductase n=1 Tax=Reichenbachiella versicolor TaxID=1821036 RepID=UPI000D6E2972|nr:SDR family oxidoreductase [Reichenbachiella versicolor]